MSISTVTIQACGECAVVSRARLTTGLGDLDLAGSHGKRQEEGKVEESESEMTESQEPRARKRVSPWEETPPLRLKGERRS